MLRFNSFRAKRYLRTRFVEGAFLLASEATDLELEIIDLLRSNVKESLGNVAIGDSWKVERLTDTSVLVKPGTAWVEGLPFANRFGKDQLVSGSILTLGTVPVGVTATDHPDGLGKIISLNQSSTTPTNNYRFVITAFEEVITNIDDPFLKNANLVESTGQKLRLNFQLNIVPVSSQTSSPIPYRDENSSSGGPITNFPDAGGTSSPNLVNEVIVTPTAAGNGEQVSLTVISGSEQIDGRDLELVLRNDPGIGGGNPLPNTPTEQQKFANGKLVDSNGTKYHINAMFNDTVSTQVVIRIDKEDGQPNPEIINTKDIKFIKKDVYTTDDVNGVPQGKIHWTIAELVWSSSLLISHDSKISDLRKSVQEDEDFQNSTNKKSNSFVVGGGDVNWDAATGNLTWSQDFKVVNPFVSPQTIATSNAVIVDGGFLVYDLDLVNGGSIEKGILPITVFSIGANSQLSGAPDLSQLSIGNIIVDSAGTIAEITYVDNLNKEIGTSPTLTGTGAANIYMDSFSAGTAKLSSNSFTLASREGNKVYIGLNDLELEDGETSQLGDGISQQLLQLLGSGISETTSSPTYASNVRGVASEGFQERIGSLTDSIGDSQEDRSAYVRSIEQVVWTGTELQFTEDIILEILNTKTGTLTTHTIEASNSPIAMNNNESLYIDIDRTANEIVVPILSDTTPIPAQTQANKDMFVLFKRIVDANGSQLYLPFSKQLMREGQSSFLGASGSGGAGTVKANFLDPLSTTLPTGSTVTIDNVAGINGDLVLFTNLVSGNNRVYELGGVGSSITWTAVRIFDGQFDPSDGDGVRLTKGDSFQEQLAVYNGTDFRVNDVVRFFDGVSANFWELGSIKATTLDDNKPNDVENVIGFDPDVWTTRTCIANDWYSVSWSSTENVFVAVGGGANPRTMRSTDGISWSSVVSANEANIWNSVTWSPSLNLFVATSSPSATSVMTSVDGLSWSGFASANNAVDWSSVAWSEDINLFVAVGSSGAGNRAMSSTNGTTWTTRVAADNTAAWSSVVWSPTLSIFTAVARNAAGADRVMTSPDGINWTIRTASQSNSWESITWSEDLGLFVACSTNGTNRIMTSPDGINWTNRTINTSYSWNEVLWVEELQQFIAVASSGPGNTIGTSPDGINWTVHPESVDIIWLCLAYSVDLDRVVVAGSGSSLMTNDAIFSTQSLNPIFSVENFGSENMILNYSILRGSNKETGQIYITSNGTDVNVARSDSSIGDAGIEFTGIILSGNLELNYTSTNLGFDGDMKYYLQRWSDSVGGPTGIPNYSGFTGSSTAAAGSPGEIQFHGGSGNLDADSFLSWNGTDKSLEMNGLQLSSLSNSLLLNDNQIAALPLITFNATTYRHAVIEYSVSRSTDFQTGRLLVCNNGSTTGFNDDFVNTSSPGITFDAVINGANVEVRYTSTNTGNTGSFKYTIRRWS